MLLRSVIAILMVVGLFQAESNAQRHLVRAGAYSLKRVAQPVQRLNRRLGLWSSAGYHHQTPGPNVGYYNPYNAHNSALVSQGYMPSNMGMGFHAPMVTDSFPVQPSPSHGSVLKVEDNSNPPSPISGGSFESFDKEDNDIKDDSDSLDLDEKDGFDFDEESELLEEKAKDTEKVTWDEYENSKTSSHDIELPYDALNYDN